MKRVSFITTESGDDLIVSFAIAGHPSSMIKSLTLLRTPKYDFILEDTERGVRVSFEGIPDDDDLLTEIEIQGHRVLMRTRHRAYDLSVRDVAPEELDEAIQVLKQMNVDDRFTLRLGQTSQGVASQPTQLTDPRVLVERLWALEDEFPQELREACMASGSTLVPDLIVQLDAALDKGDWSWSACHAIDLLGSMGDHRAVPTLLRCLEVSDALETLHSEASEALIKLGDDALEGCLEAYAASSNGDFCDSIASVLERVGLQDERIYEVLLDTLARNPVLGANCLALYGDPRAVPALMVRFDELPIQEKDDWVANQVFLELRCAIEDLGGALTAAQQVKYEQSAAMRQRFARGLEAALSGPATFREGTVSSATRAPRPVVRTKPKLGRNAPCWCGSGKKYKKCHLNQDDR